MSFSPTYEASSVTSPIALTTQMHSTSNNNNTTRKSSSYFMNVDGVSNRRMLFEHNRAAASHADSLFSPRCGGMVQKEPEDGLNHTHDISYIDDNQHVTQLHYDAGICSSSRNSSSRCMDSAAFSSAKLKDLDMINQHLHCHQSSSQSSEKQSSYSSKAYRLSKELSHRQMQQISLNFLDDPHEQSLSIDEDSFSRQGDRSVPASSATAHPVPTTLHAIDNSDYSKDNQSLQTHQHHLQHLQQFHSQSHAQLMQMSRSGSPDSRTRRRIGMTVIHPASALSRRMGMNISTGNLLSFLQNNQETTSLAQKGLFMNQSQMTMMMMNLNNNINNNNNNGEDDQISKKVCLNLTNYPNMSNSNNNNPNYANSVAQFEDQVEPMKLRNQIMIFAYLIQFVKAILVRFMRRDFNMLSALQYRIIGDTSIAVDKKKIELMQSVKYRNIFERINYIRSINAMDNPNSAHLSGSSSSNRIPNSNNKNRMRKSIKQLLQSFQKEVLGNLKRKIVKVSLIKPNTPIMLAWEIFFLLLVFLLLIVIPLGIGFSLPTFILTILRFVNYVEVVAFSFDVFLGFHTGFYEFGEVVMNRKRIQKEYYQNKFVLNLLSIGLVIVSILLDQPVFNFVALLLKIKSLIEKAETIDFNFQLFQKFTSIFALVKLFVMLVLMIHGFGCVFHLIGSSQSINHGGQMDNWIENAGLTNAGLQEKYVNSIYFTIVTMVTIGYGDIHPVNIYEKLFVVGMAFISSVLFAFTVNLIGQIIAEMQKRSKEFRQKQFVMWSYMNEKQVKKSTQMRVLKYLEFVQDFSNANLEEGAKILQSCSPDIKDELLKDYFGRILKKTRVFRATFSKEFIAAVSLRMKEKKFAPGEVIINKGHHMTQLFFITKGQTEYFYANNDYHRNLCDLNEGLIDLRLFFTQQPADISVRSKGITTAAYIDKDTWLEVIQQFPLDKEKECSLRDQYINDQRFEYSCKSCGQFRHQLFSCPQLNYIAKEPNFFRKIQMDSHQELRVASKRKTPSKILRNTFQSNRMFAQKLKQLRWQCVKDIYEDFDEIDAEDESCMLETDRQFYMRCPKISASHLLQAHRIHHRASSQAANAAAASIFNNAMNNSNQNIHNDQSLIELADTDNDTHDQMMYLQGDHYATSSLSSVSESSSALNLSRNQFHFPNQVEASHTHKEQPTSNTHSNTNNNANNNMSSSPTMTAAMGPGRLSINNHIPSGSELPFSSQMTITKQNSGEIVESLKLKHNPNSYKSEDGGDSNGIQHHVPALSKRLQKRSHSTQHPSQSQAAGTSLNLPQLSSTQSNNYSNNQIKAKVFLSKSNNHIEVMLDSSHNQQESCTMLSMEETAGAVAPATTPFTNHIERLGIHNTSQMVSNQPLQQQQQQQQQQKSHCNLINNTTQNNGGYSVSVTPLQMAKIDLLHNLVNHTSPMRQPPTLNLRNPNGPSSSQPVVPITGGTSGAAMAIATTVQPGGLYQDDANNNTPRSSMQKQQSTAAFAEPPHQPLPNLNGVLEQIQELLYQFKDKAAFNRQSSVHSSYQNGNPNQQQSPQSANPPLRFKSSRYASPLLPGQKRLSIQFEKQLTLRETSASVSQNPQHQTNEMLHNEQRLPAVSVSSRSAHQQPSLSQQLLHSQNQMNQQRTPERGTGIGSAGGIGGATSGGNTVDQFFAANGAEKHLFGKCQFGFDSMREYTFYYPRFNYSNVVKAFKKLVQFQQIFMHQKDMGKSLSPEVYNKFLQNNLKRKFLKKTTFVNRNKQPAALSTPIMQPPSNSHNS